MEKLNITNGKRLFKNQKIYLHNNTILYINNRIKLISLLACTILFSILLEYADQDEERSVL